MRDQHESLTSTAVALARVVHAPTPAARALLPAGAAQLSALWSAPAIGWPLRVAAQVVSGGLVNHLRLRTAAIDSVVTEAIRHGATQLVLLGAGLDARAHRLRGLDRVTVWEVDHPATQAAKRQRGRCLTTDALAVHYVPVDFAEAGLVAQLRAAGLPAGELSVWVWEGVTMYLPAAATRATLSAIAALASDGSTVAMTYMEHKVLRGTGARALAHSFFSLLGEPLIGGMDRDQARAMVDEAGFATVSDAGARQWAVAHGGHWATSVLYGAERLLVARR